MTHDIRDYDAFIRHVADLDIELSVNKDGVYTVCTTSEPFFCYDADTQEEAAKLVSKTIVSYGRLFFGLHDLEEPTVKPAEDGGSVAVERGTPIGQLKPIFALAA
jgi:CO dehydrogenase/acetyl-CoA synthase alpha subunit